MNGKFKLLSTFVLLSVVNVISGHGMLMDPVNRASRWRVDRLALPDYNDNQGFCGGYGVQWGTNGGKCGLCGDDYRDATPRNHELGGKYGSGQIMNSYAKNSVVETTVKITANHRGYFYFKLCCLDNSAETEACFERNKIKTADGADTWPLTSTVAQEYKVKIRMPNIKCNRAVLQWTYVAGNNWGYCEDGSGKLGCGPQEHFRTCSDIQLV